MSRFVVSFIFLFLGWLALTFTFDVQEMLAGALISLTIAYLAGDYLFHKRPLKVFNPRRWAYVVYYFFNFLWAEIKCHLDVSYRIITGRINPAIIRVRTKHGTEIGRTLLANSITLTPGTLVVRAGNDFFVHWIAYSKKGGAIPDSFERIGRKVTDD